MNKCKNFDFIKKKEKKKGKKKSKGKTYFRIWLEGNRIREEKILYFYLISMTKMIRKEYSIINIQLNNFFYENFYLQPKN